MRTVTPTLLAAIAVITAGCVTLDPALDTADAVIGDVYPVVGEPIIQDHDHADPAQHAAGVNTAVLGRHNGWADDGAFPAGAGGVNEIAIWNDLVITSRSGSLGGFAILDFADPANPVMLGEYLAEPGADIEVSADGNWVFHASQRTTPNPDSLQSKPITGNQHRGIYVVDISDKANPRFESFFPLPTNGPHTVSYNCYGHVTKTGCDGREILAIQTYDLIPNVATGDLLGAVPVTQRILLGEFTTLADGTRGIETLAVWSVTDLPGAGQLFFPHDAVIQKHPVTGQYLLYAAYWDAGLVVLDVTDPADPTFVSRYTDFRPTRLASLHYAEPFPMLVQGRHITAVAPEIVTADEAGQLTFIDTTDPANPTYLGYWNVPGGLVVDSAFIFSPHNFDIRCEADDDAGGEGGGERRAADADANGGLPNPGARSMDDGHGSAMQEADECRVVIGHNHAGMWEMDASTLALMEEAPTTAFFQPVPEEGCRGRCVGVWGAMYRHDGSIAVSDGGTGIWIVKSTFGEEDGGDHDDAAPEAGVDDDMGGRAGRTGR